MAQILGGLITYLLLAIYCHEHYKEKSVLKGLESCVSKYKTKPAISKITYQLLPVNRQVSIISKISKNKNGILTQLLNRTTLRMIPHEIHNSDRLLFVYSSVFTSKMYSQDYFPITEFSSKELAKGEPLGWKTHKGICREIKNRIMPRIVEIEGRKMLYVNANDNGAILFKPVRLNPKEYPF